MRLPRYRFGEFELNPASRELSRLGERVSLPPKSFECLAYLIARRDRAVGRDELIAAVWGRVEVSDAVVAQTLLRARKALDSAGERQSKIRTVPRFGYRWVAPVQEIGAAELAANVDSSVQNQPADERPLAIPAQRGMPTRAGSWLLGLALFALVALGWILGHEQPASVGQMQAVVLVLPVAVVSPDSDTTWVRLGAMDYVANRLRRRGLKVLPSEQTLHLTSAWREQVFSPHTLEKLQASSGARWILAPEAERDRRGWRMRLTVREGDQQHVIESRGSTALTAAAAVSDSWLRRIGRYSAGSESTPGPLTERVQQIDAELLAGQLATARRLVDSAPQAQREDARLRVRAGQIEFRAGRIDDAAAIFKHVLERRPMVASNLRAKALMGQGAVEVRRGAFAKAEAYYTQALALIEAAATGEGDAADLGSAYNGRGVALVQQRKMEAAVRDMGMARIAMQRSGNLIEAACVSANLGQIETERGHYAQALQEYDGAIAVFERFDVRDYLAASLMGKAATQLELVQPSAAIASIERASKLAKSLEDPYLASGIEFVRTRALLDTGRLRAARSSLVRLRTLGIPVSDPQWQELSLRLGLAVDAPGAAARAQRYASSAGVVPGSLALVTVQAALRNHQADNAQSWLSRAPAQAGTADVGWYLAQALVASSQRRNDSALQLARQGMAIAERTGSPRDRVRTGVLLARLLLRQGQRNAAAAVLGDLDAFVDMDYGVAWTTAELYRQLGDQSMVVDAFKRVQALRGERDAAIEPAL